MAQRKQKNNERIIQFEGKTYHFPADATDAEIRWAISDYPDFAANPPPIPKPRDPITNPDEHEVNVQLGRHNAPDPAHDLYRSWSDELDTEGAQEVGSRWVHNDPIGIYLDKGPGTLAESVPEFYHGNVSRGGHKAISGGLTTIAPVALPAGLVVAPAATAAGLVGGTIASSVAHPVAERLGATPDQADLISDVAGLAGGYGGAKLPGVMSGMAGRMAPAVRKVANLPNPFGWKGRAARAVAGPLSSWLESRGGIKPDKLLMQPGDVPSGSAHSAPFEPATVGDATEGTDWPIVQPKTNVNHERVPLWKQVGTTTTKPKVQSPSNVVHDTSPRSLIDQVQTQTFLAPDAPEPNITRQPAGLLTDGGSGKDLSSKVKLFHGTPEENIPSILENGILPLNDYGDGLQVFASPIKSIADAFGAPPLESQPPTGPINRGATLEINAPRRDWSHPGPDDYAEWTSDKSVPVSQISGISYDPPHNLPESPLDDFGTGLSPEVARHVTGRGWKPPNNPNPSPVHIIPPGTMQPVYDHGPSLSTDDVPNWPEHVRSPFQLSKTSRELDNMMYDSGAVDSPELGTDDPTAYRSDASPYRDPESTKIPWDKVRSTQSAVHRPLVEQVAADPTTSQSEGDPQLWYDKGTGETHIIDGHHRASGQSESGQPYLTGDIWNPEDLPDTGLLPMRRSPGSLTEPNPAQRINRLQSDMRSNTGTTPDAPVTNSKFLPPGKSLGKKAAYYRDLLNNPELVNGAVKVPGTDELAVPIGGSRTYGFSNRMYDNMDEAQALANHLKQYPGFDNVRVRDWSSESTSDYRYSVEWGKDSGALDNESQGKALGYKDSKIREFLNKRLQSDMENQ